jgi:hypothetical protein
MGEEHRLTPERRENLRNALAILSLQFSGGDGDPATGRESTADENVPVPGPPHRIKLLHEMSSPSSDWTAR